MSAQTEGDRPTARPARPWRIRRWSLWEVPHRLAISVLLVEATTLGLVVVVAVRMPLPDVIQLLQTALLAGLGLLHTEIAIGVERIRRRVTVGNHANLSSVWTFAGALALPPRFRPRASPGSYSRCSSTPRSTPGSSPVHSP